MPRTVAGTLAANLVQDAHLMTRYPERIRRQAMADAVEQVPVATRTRDGELEVLGPDFADLVYFARTRMADIHYNEKYRPKRLSYAELHAEWTRAAFVTGVHGPHAEGSRVATLHRFLTTPHEALTV